MNIIDKKAFFYERVKKTKYGYKQYQNFLTPKKKQKTKKIWLHNFSGLRRKVWYTAAVQNSFVMAL